MRLSWAQRQLLEAMVGGASLKSHRDLEGQKSYLLYDLGEATPKKIPAGVVEALYRQGLLESNQKFPTATYLLTDKGKMATSHSAHLPLTTKGWN